MNKLSHKMRQFMKLMPSIDPAINHPEITPEAKPVPQKTDFDYEFVFNHPHATTVQMAGCFNGWTPTQHLTRQPGSNRWSVKVTLPIIEGQEKYQYKFVVNGSNWEINQDMPKSGDGRGNVNNEVMIPKV